MNLDLTAKRAIVAGSTQDLGLATAVELMLLGAEALLAGKE